ncbi:MAG: hypothetical protein GXO26_01800 [Crenarchaeota archaeon]|nr:hypothetical protein [Thermoproteota archaeon]
MSLIGKEAGEVQEEINENNIMLEVLKDEIERTIRKLSALWSGVLDVFGNIPVRFSEEEQAPGWTEGEAIYINPSMITAITYPFTGKYNYNPIIEALRHAELVKALEKGAQPTVVPREEFYRDIIEVVGRLKIDNRNAVPLAVGNSLHAFSSLLCTYYPSICEELSKIASSGNVESWFRTLVLGSVPTVLLHELFHILYAHPERLRSLLELLENRYGKLAAAVGKAVANRAADVVVNADALLSLLSLAELGGIISPYRYLSVLLTYLPNLIVAFPFDINAAFNLASRILMEKDLSKLLPLAENIVAKSGEEAVRAFNEEPTVEGKLLIALVCLVLGLPFREVKREVSRRLSLIVGDRESLIKAVRRLVSSSSVAKLGVEPVAKRIVAAIMYLLPRAEEPARGFLKKLLSCEHIHVKPGRKGGRARPGSRQLPGLRGAASIGTGLMTREAERAEKAVLDWRRLLAAILSTYMGHGYRRSTYAKPSIVPGLPGTYSLRGCLWTLLDVSGSISEKELGRFLAELERILRTIPEIEKLKVVEWSADAVGPIIVRSPSEVRRLEIKSSWATAIRPALRLVLKHCKPSTEGIIIFTDSMISDVEENETRRLMEEISKRLSPKIWITIAEEPPEYVRRLGWQVLYYKIE